MNRIDELEKIIKKNDYLYWQGETQISDEEYDLLIEELKSLSPDHYLIKRVNDLSNIQGDKIQHDNPMLSLDKVYCNEEIFKWVNNKARNLNEVFLIQPKFDGISGKITHYEQNNFSNSILSTRGNGYVGKNISNKLPIINFETKSVQAKELYGEILIKKDDFYQHFSKFISPSTNKPYKNPRNATAGIIGTDDISFFIEQQAKLTFVDYNLYSYEVKALEFMDKWETIVTQLTNLPYPMDGIVIKIKDEDYAKSLGNTAHHPRSAVAFKFKNPRVETKVIGVEWSFGKNYLTPVAILEPVDINGITVERVSVANYENVKKLQLNIGDDVIIERAGDVIPHILEVKHNDSSISPFIENCPCCQTKLIVDSPEILCPNEKCQEKIIRRLLFSIKSLGIEGIGIPTIKKIITTKNIDNLYDFMQISRLDLFQIGFGEKTTLNIINAIKNINSIKDYQFVTCLNIADVGEEVAKLLLEVYSIEDLMKITDSNLLVKIKGIGQKTADKIIDYFQNNLEYIMLLRSLFVIEKDIVNNDFCEQTICFTGAMEYPRKYYENIALEKNIKPINGVTKDLTYLVTADINSNSSKIQKAKKYGINIISIEEFMSL